MPPLVQHISQMYESISKQLPNSVELHKYKIFYPPEIIQ